MKKLIPGILALMMCFGGLAGCDSLSNMLPDGLGNLIPGLGTESSTPATDDSSNNPDDSTPAQAHAAELANVRSLVFNELIEDNISGNTSDNRSFTVPNTYNYEGKDYDVSWTVTDANGNAVAGVSISEGEQNDTVIISVNDAVNYVLTGTITCPEDCCSISHKFNRTATAAPVHVAITEAPQENTPYILYVWQANAKTDCYLTANNKPGYPWYLLSDPDYTNAVNLYVKNVEGGFNLYRVDPETNENVYLNIRMDGTHTSSFYETLEENATPSVWTFDAEKGTIVTTCEGKTCYLGCNGSYTTVSAQTKFESTTYVGYLGTMKDKSEIVVSDKEKVDDTLATLTFDEKYTLDKENIRLATAGIKYAEVAITWAAEGEGVVLEPGFISFIIPTEATTVKVTATATCGDYSDSKEFTIQLGPKSVEVADKTDVAAILAAAKNLAAGETLPGIYTLTGTITSIDTAWDSQYNNITVSFKVNDDTTMKCYRLKNGEGVDAASALKVGDIITVNGQITSYYGKLQFAAGCLLQAVETEGGSTTPDTPTYSTPEEIVAAAWALAPGATLGEYTLTGVVKSVDDPYSTQYKNVTVTIVVADMENYPIICFRMKGTDAENVKVGDTITVTGTLMNYLSSSAAEGDPGKVEFSPCTLDTLVSGEEGGDTPVEPEQPDAPSGGETTMTQEDIVNAAYALEKGAALDGTQTLTGVVISVDEAYSSQFGNITVTIVIGDLTNKPIKCYRLKGTGAENLGVADEITVSGTLKNYNGTIEFDTGCTFVLVSAHECTEWTEKTCLTPATCLICGDYKNNELADHNFVDGACSVCDTPAGVEISTASLSFADKANRTAFDTNQQVWEQNGVILTNDKGASTSNVADYSNPARFYKSSKITITAPGQITKIEFTANSASYATALQSSIASDANVTVTVSGAIVTVTFAEAVDSFVIASLTGGQVRMNSLVVSYIA